MQNDDPQLVHQGFLPFGPLVLERAFLKNQTVAPDRDRAVLRRSEPSSRGVLTGEQTDPWDLLQPQDTSSRHRCRFLQLLGGLDYTFILLSASWRSRRQRFSFLYRSNIKETPPA